MHKAGLNTQSCLDRKDKVCIYVKPKDKHKQKNLLDCSFSFSEMQDARQMYKSTNIQNFMLLFTREFSQAPQRVNLLTQQPTVLL